MAFVEKAAGVDAIAKFEKDNTLVAIPVWLTCTLVAFWVGGLTLQTILEDGLPLLGGTSVHLSVWMAGAAAMLIRFVAAAPASTAASAPALWTAATSAAQQLMVLGATHLVLWIIA